MILLILACASPDDISAEIRPTFHTETVACDADRTAWWTTPDGLILVQAFIQTDTGQLPQAIGMLTPGTEYPFWCQYQGHNGAEYGDSVVVTWGVL